MPVISSFGLEDRGGGPHGLIACWSFFLISSSHDLCAPANSSHWVSPARSEALGTALAAGDTEAEDPQSPPAVDSVWWGDSEGQERPCGGQRARSARGHRAGELPPPRPALPSLPLLGTASRPPALQPDSSFLKGHLVTTK